MTDRERLLELIFDIAPYGTSEMFAAHLADYLLVNGVTFATDNNVGRGWIPVTERLPADDTTVFVCDAETGNMHAATFTDKRWHLDAGWLLDLDDFTHWMPLPEPPQKS